MANGNSFFGFAAGLVAGAALAILAFTERGHEFVNDVQKKGEKFFDDAKRKMGGEADVDGFDEEFDEEEAEEA